MLVDTRGSLADSRVGDNLGLGLGGCMLKDLVLDSVVFKQIPLVETSCRCRVAIPNEGKRRDDIQQSRLHIDLSCSVYE